MFSGCHRQIWEAKPTDIRDGDAIKCINRSNAFDPSLADVALSKKLGRGSDLDQKLENRARHIAAKCYRGALFAIVPLYVTSICSERCVYCNFRTNNNGKDVTRVRLGPTEILSEVDYLVQEKGLRVIELVYASDPKHRVESICHDIELVCNRLETLGGGYVGLNAEPFDIKDYKQLRDAGLSFAVLWQETYDPLRYRDLHPGKTKKTDFFYRLDAPERMIAAGLRNIGMGVLSGLSDWRTDWWALIKHEHYLWENYGVVPVILGIPRIKDVRGAGSWDKMTSPNNDQFKAILNLHRIFSPYTLPFINTREDWATCLILAGKGGALFTFECTTIPGGYSLKTDGHQFPVYSFEITSAIERLKGEGLHTYLSWSFEKDKTPYPLQQSM